LLSSSQRGSASSFGRGETGYLNSSNMMSITTAMGVTPGSTSDLDSISSMSGGGGGGQSMPSSIQFLNNKA
jgi:hypothetical protein